MIGGLKPYPTMKPSGVEWLAEVPEHWQIFPGRACYVPRKTPNSGLQERTVLSLSYGRIRVRQEEELHGLVPASFEAYQIVESGDIICRPTDLQNDQTSLRFGLSRQRGIITSAYMCLRTRSPFMEEYGHLLLHAYDLSKVFYGLGSGLRQNLGWDDFKYLPCIVPPLAEQAAIVRYLDHVDRRINRYIRAKQRLVELLEEQKQAIIHQAVTRGLDPDVPLKPSGVEWLGDIPEHWEVRRSRYVFHEVDRRSTGGQETHLSMSQKLGLVPSSRIEGWRLVAESYVGAKLCEPGDIVLNRLKAHLGVFALARDSGLVSADYTVLRPRIEVNSRYFEAVYRATSCRVELRKRTKGIVEGFWRLYTPDFLEVRVPVPPVSEQLAITLYLDSALGDVDRSVERIWSELTLLNEYRTRLIADVVHGKLDVREAAADLPEADPADIEDIIEIDEVAAEELGAELKRVAT